MTSKVGLCLKLFIAGLAGVLSINVSLAQKVYDPGATDTEVKVGNTSPYSGPASSYAAIAKAQAAYFQMISDNGGSTAGRSTTFLMMTPTVRQKPSNRCESLSRAMRFGGEKPALIAEWLGVSYFQEALEA